MDLADLHRRLEQIVVAALAPEDDAELRAVGAHADAGCSLCARALVNTRETAAELARAEGAGPTPALRARVLGAAGARLRAPAPGVALRRFFDPSAELARRHAGAPGDAERTAEVDDLAAGLPHEGDACGRFLAQLSRSIGFPLLFVSVVRGDRVGYRAQRGLDVGSAELRDRRREATFCTHALGLGAGRGAPLLVPNAAAEPFFRGSTMVARLGVGAYAGVPLTTARGVTIGTVCAMDFRPRAIDADVVRALELYTEPVLAEVERVRRLPAERVPRSAAGTPVHPAPWFHALLDVELRLARAAGRPTALLVASGPRAEAFADVAGEHECAGRLGPEAVAVLLAAGAAGRAGALGEALAQGGEALPFALVPGGSYADGAAWAGAALAAAPPAR
jgi:hypothetical protein